MAKERGKPPIFDFGGKIDDLKKNAKRETGHSAPRQPEFQTWVVRPKKKKTKAKKKRSKSATTKSAARKRKTRRKAA